MFNEKIEIDKVYNCDCMDLMRAMVEQEIKADCLLTDIPYDGVNRKSNGLRSLNKKQADILKFNLFDYLEIIDKVIKGNFIIFCGDNQISEITKFFREKEYSVRLLIWEKTNPSPMNGQYIYLSSIECCVYAKKKNGTFNGFCESSVIRNECGKNEIHPTMKPLKLWYKLLQTNTNENQLVLDTCMGSFTTAVACHKMQRHFIGAELDKEYFDLGSKRLADVQNQISIFDL